MILSLIISNGRSGGKLAQKTTRKQRPLTSSAYDERNNQESSQDTAAILAVMEDVYEVVPGSWSRLKLI